MLATLYRSFLPCADLSVCCADERFYPTNDWQINPCGTTSIVIGDGGNSEGVRLVPPPLLLCALRCCHG